MSEGYVYFPGCSLKGTGRAYEESLMTLFRLLDLKLDELEDWNCCGATSYMSIDEDSAFRFSARNLAMAHQSGNSQLLAPCAACYLVLRKTQDYVQHYPEIRKHVTASLKCGAPAPGRLRSVRAIRWRFSTTMSAWPASRAK